MTTTPKSKFGQVVFAKLRANQDAKRKPDSLRSLARQISNGDPGLFETYKRSLNRWCAGTKPTQPNRDLVAHHLEIDASELDDEEDHPVSLDELLRLHIRQILRDEMKAVAS